jgi:hypothetical protein
MEAHKRNFLFPLILATLFACLGPRVGSAADDAKPPAQLSNKLTLAYYGFSSGKTGVDANLRHTFKSSTAWIGGYREGNGFDQARVGYEYDYIRERLTFIPSVQAATRGFLGVSAYGEVGRSFFGIGGWGRTNLRPYWNLAFDPNDYVQFGAGYRDDSGNRVSAFAIRDARLGTGQTNTHLYFRRYLPHDWRLTADIVREHGHGDNGLMVLGWSASLDIDWHRWFVRVARDPHVNYTQDRQFRLAGGLRF